MSKISKTQATANSDDSSLPVWLDPDKEANLFLKAHKQALSKKWSLKSMKPLFDAVDLAFFLIALDRKPDAMVICALLSDSVKFANNFNIWTPVGYAITIKALLLRKAGKATEANAALGPIITNPFNRTPIQIQIDKDLSALPAELDKAFAQSAKKLSCQTMARKLYTACWYLEMYYAKVPGFSGYSPEPVETVWETGLEKLARRLNS